MLTRDGRCGVAVIVLEEDFAVTNCVHWGLTEEGRFVPSGLQGSGVEVEVVCNFRLGKVGVLYGIFQAAKSVCEVLA